MIAAHEAEMRAVAVQGALCAAPDEGGGGAAAAPPEVVFKAYEFGVADLQVADLESLTMQNVRALFADRVYPWDRSPELKLQLESPENKRALKTRWAGE